MRPGYGSLESAKLVRDLSGLWDRTSGDPDVSVLEDCSSHFSSSLHLRGSNIVGLEPGALASAPMPISLLDLSGSAVSALSRSSSLSQVQLFAGRPVRVYTASIEPSCNAVLSSHDVDEDDSIEWHSWLGMSMLGLEESCLLPAGVAVQGPSDLFMCKKGILPAAVSNESTTM